MLGSRKIRGLGVLICVFVCVNIKTATENIKSDPLFLLWKGWEYVVHKLIMREHTRPQKCIMPPYEANHKSQLHFALVQVFDKEIAPQTWWGLSSAICSIYAHRHGYDYVYAHVRPHNSSRMQINPRTTHWSRIPVLLWLLDHKAHVHWWLYLDMDAMINPMAMQFPISWIFNTIERDNGCVIRASPKPNDLIFFSNSDQEPHMPCSGSFLASNSSAKSLALWWNYPGDAYFNSHSEYDQHRVHELLFFEPRAFSFAVLDIRQFYMKPTSYILHYSGSRLLSENKFRHRIIRSIQKSRSIHPKEIENAIEAVKTLQTIQCSMDLGSMWFEEHDSRIRCQ